MVDKDSRGDLKLGIEDVGLSLFDAWGKPWHIQQEIGDICSWCSKTALESLEPPNHHLLGDICRRVWQQFGGDMLEITFNILLDADVDKSGTDWFA